MTIAPAPSERPRPWGFWATLAWGLLALALSQGAAFALARWWSLIGPDLSGLKYDGLVLSVTTLVATPIEILVLALLALWAGWPWTDYLGLTLPRRRDVLLGVVCFLVLMPALDLLTTLFGYDVVSPFQVESYRSARADGVLPLLWFAFVLVGPAAEEVLFRGFLYRGWAKRERDVWPAIVATALLWSLLHVQYDLFEVAQIFLVGLVLGWFRWRSGTVTLTILLHAMNNVWATAETVIRAGH